MESFNCKVSRYVNGKPFKTEIIVENLKKNPLEDLKKFNIEKENDEITLISEMKKADKVFGLGENMRGINKRGGIYESFCSDDPNHAPDKKSLYGAHNFLILDGEEKIGIYVDFPGNVVFDVGFSNKNQLKIKITKKDFEIYIIESNSLREITREFLKLIGKSYVPPKWAFGYIQSRWSYPTDEAIEGIADKFIEKDIPCDGICLDIDYMERFKDFTIDKNNFKDFKGFVANLKAKGIKAIPIIDAGVKIEKDYDVYEEGIKNNYFVKGKEGNPFVAAVWPGKVHFPDFLNKDARLWFGKKYKTLTDLGVEGFWNDMNEPAIFYSEDGLKKAFDKVDELKNQELDIYGFFNLKDAVLGISNSLEDYKAFYHNVDGEIVNHYDVHNLYGYNMTKAASEGFDEIDKDKRFLLFSRASSIGMHRYGGIWTGDNCSFWEHLKLNIQMMPSLNLCGFTYSGADTGGFGSNADSELLIRWNQFSIFTPLYRNHAALGTRNQEPFAYDNETENIIRNTIKFRYAMIPYLYSEFMKAVNSSDTFISPLCFDYNDKQSREVEDQLLIGESLMVAPIYEANKKGRYVYLPEDMLLWKVKNHKDINLEVVERGHHYLTIDLDETALFIRKNKAFIIGDSAASIEKINNEKLTLITYIEDTVKYNLYDDDGISRNTEGSSISIKVEIKENGLNITTKNNGNDKVKEIKVIAITTKGKEYRKTVII